MKRQSRRVEGSAEDLWARGFHYEACLINPFIRFEPGHYKLGEFTEEQWAEVKRVHAERMNATKKK